MVAEDKSTVAVVQAASVVYDRDRSLQKALDLANDAAQKGARVVVFPEAFISGYPKGSTFGSVVGTRTMEGRDEFQQYWNSAVDVPGPITNQLAKAARDLNIYLVMGVIERDAGTLYCCILFFSPEGKLMGKHRKLMPTGCERLIWGFADGSTMPVFETPHGKLGAVVCWENYMPLMRTAMYAKDIQIWCAPTADQRDTWIASMQHIAIEGRCFVLSCNQFSKRSDFPEDFPNELGNDPDTVISRGGSCIVNPFGEIIAGPIFEKEKIITAQIDLKDIARGKFDFDVVGHYARPDRKSTRLNSSH